MKRLGGAEFHEDRLSVDLAYRVDSTGAVTPLYASLPGGASLHEDGGPAPPAAPDTPREN